MALNIFDRPQHIADDTVQFNLYLLQPNATKSDAEALAALILAYVEETLPNHLWNKDPFLLSPHECRDSPSQWLLESRMRVGDSVDDEWLVVWLVKQITARWDVLASVFDTDGEFLLIEAAEYLPSWIEPSNAENRVWIYKSELHIIPISYVSAPSARQTKRKLPGAKESDDELDAPDSQHYLSVPDAKMAILSDSSGTKASTDVNEAVWKRVNGYPASARQHIHFTSAFLPLDIGRALSVIPSLVQRAAEAFYTRDPHQLRVVHRMSRFPPDPSVLQTIKITRTAYAQLVGQQFHRPKAFGTCSEPEGSLQWRWRDVGMKLACGFEILYQESKGRAQALHSADNRSKTEAAHDALQRDTGYVKYIATLKAVGYFKDEIEGSSLWKQLEVPAMNKFIEMHREDDASRTSFAEAVEDALSNCPGDTFHPSTSEEDSDDWLNIDVEELDRMLESKGSKPMDVDSKSPEEEAIQSQTKQLQSLSEKVQSFVEGEGTLEGAKFNDDVDSDDEGDVDLEEFSDGMPSTDDEAEEVKITSEARQSAMENLVPPLDASEYGKMPASFHRNSQKTAAPPKEDEEVKTKEFVKPTRPLLFPKDKFDGVDSDDETDSEEERLNEVGGRDGENSDSEEDRPQVVGDVEINMEEEEEEFLNFSREALGITKDMWDNIVKDRNNRGAYVPKAAGSVGASAPASTGAGRQTSAPRPIPVDRPPAPNTNLDSFEAVMQAMEDELAKHKTAKNRPSKGKERAESDDDMEDVEAAMDEELKNALARDDDDDEEDELGRADIDYNLIKNFLESYKSQAGQSGPVGNLAGRLQPNWKLPRDER